MSSDWSPTHDFNTNREGYYEDILERCCHLLGSPNYIALPSAIGRLLSTTVEGMKAEDKPPGFQTQLCSLINRFSLDSRSNTPDFILSDFIGSVLETFDEAVGERDAWCGRANTEDQVDA